MAKPRSDKSDEASAWNNLGIVYRSTSKPEKALECYQQALPLLQKAGNKNSEAQYGCESK